MADSDCCMTGERFVHTCSGVVIKYNIPDETVKMRKTTLKSPNIEAHVNIRETHVSHSHSKLRRVCCTS